MNFVDINEDREKILLMYPMLFSACGMKERIVYNMGDDGYCHCTKSTADISKYCETPRREMENEKFQRKRL